MSLILDGQYPASTSYVLKFLQPVINSMFQSFQLLNPEEKINSVRVNIHHILLPSHWKAIIPGQLYKSRVNILHLCQFHVVLSHPFRKKKPRDQKLLMASEVSFKEFSRFIQQLRSQRPGLKLTGFAYIVFMHSLTTETMWMYLRFYGTKVRHVR